jgi:hypothetical protein
MVNLVSPVPLNWDMVELFRIAIDVEEKSRELA